MTARAPTKPMLQVGSVGCGLLMAIAAGGAAVGWAATLTVLVTIAAVPAGLVSGRIATAAVLLAVIVIGLCGPPPALAVASGLSAVGYLLLRDGAEASGAITAATVLAAVGFGAAGLVAATFELRLPWLPLLAAPAVFGCYVLAVRPLLEIPGNDRTAD